MSLQVWLPLNGTLENHGLMDLQFSTSNSKGALASATSGGKVVSGLYKRTTANTIDYIISNKSITLDGDVSMCCWAKVTGIGSSQTANGIFGQHGHLTGGLGITMKDVSSTDLRMSVNTGAYGDSHGSSSDRTYCSYYGATNIYNAWHHLCLTYDSTTKQLRMYVDGKLDCNPITLNGNNTTARPVILFAWSTDHLSAPDYRPPCELNDVRIYDHVLSPREVKEISKGLRLQYQLKSARITNHAAGYPFNIYNNFSVGASLTQLNETFMGHPVYRLTMTPTSANVDSFKTELWSHGVYHGTWTFSANTKYCYWIYYRPVSHNNVEVGGVASNIAGWTEIAPHYFGDGWYRVGQYRDGSVGADKSDNIFTSFRTTTAAANVPITIDFCAPHLISATSEIVETYGAINNSNVEKDVSGYDNHATIAGTITAEANSPRYKNSYYMQGSSYLVPPAMSFTGMADSYTISYWAKIGDMNGKMVWGFADGNRLNVYPSSHFNWNTGDGADNPFRSGSTNLAFTPYNGGWHHYAITGNGSTATLYIDGIARGTAKSYKAITGTQLIISGWDTSGSYKWGGGNISDYRIYATCFSAEDVAALYSTGASISKDGTAFGYEFDEFNTNKKSAVTKDGISTTGLNDSVCHTYDMKTKVLDDGSTWARIHYLDLTYDKTFFANSSEVAKCINKNNRYSRMGVVDNFKSSPSLPIGYTELEYIKSTGTQWINTGAIIGSNTWVDTNLMFDDAFSYNMMFGSWTDSFAVSLRGTNIVCAAVGATSSQDIGSTTSVGVRYNIILGPGKGYVQNGVTFPLGGSSNASSGRTILLFGASAYAEDVPHQWVSFGVGKIYSFKIYNGITGDPASSILVRDFVPCKNPSGTVGMYDLVEKKFYGNNGSGSFTAGTFVSKYEFMLTYPSLSSTGYNRWSQTSSPNASSVTGYQPISISWSAHSSGIRTHGSDCLYNCDSGGTWYAPIGQYNIWEGGIPAADGTPQSITELWVRTDKCSHATQAKIYDGAIVARDFIEL